MKKFLCFLFVSLFALSLASCNIGGGTGTGDGGDDDDRITVTFWHAMGQANQTIISKMIASFEEKYPEYKVEQASQGGYTDLLDKIKSNIKAGSGPVVAQTYPDHVVSYLTSKGAVVDLNTYAYDEELGFEAQGIDETVYVESFWDESFSYDTKGSMYSLPFNKSTEVVYYNQDIFAKYNWMVDICGYKAEDVYEDPSATTKVFKDSFIWNPTWQQLVKIGEEFKKTDEYASFVAAETSVAAFGYDSQSNLLITLTQQLASLDPNQTYGLRGEKAYTQFNSKGQGEFTFLSESNPYAKAAVKFYKENYDLGYFATSGTLGVSYCSDAFKAGSCIVTIGSSAGATYNDPGVDGFAVGVATYPQQEAANENQYQVIQQGTNLTLFTQPDPEAEKAGWLWILHMINYENAYMWCTETAYFPIRSDVYNSQAYQDYVVGKITVGGDTIYEPDLKARAAACGWAQQSWFYTNVAFNGSDTARNEIETLVQAVLLNTEGATVDEAINTAFANCKTALKDYIVEIK